MLRVLYLLLSLSIPATTLADAIALRIQGSNTIGAELGPALVRGMLEDQGLVAIQTQTHQANEQTVTARDSQGRTLQFEIAAHGSSTGFTGLLAGQADLAAASRPITDGELVSLERLGDLKSFEAEHVIAIDGVAIIVHPDSPVQHLSMAQLAQLFSGEISDWSALGGHGAVHLYARDDRSGTWETFREQVLTPQGKQLAASATRLESSEALSDKVSRDPQAIGFIGLPYVRSARALAIADGDSKPMLPHVSLIATEDYPLARRLYFYSAPNRPSPWADALIKFSQSARGQAIVAGQGFVAQTVQAIEVPASSSMPLVYRQLAAAGQRLSVNFRFAEGSASLDNKALADIGRVLEYLKTHGKLQQQASLIGFGDAKDDPARAVLLSKLRAMAVRRELAKGGAVLRDIQGLGAQMPVAANDVDEGRIKNRRVEVWVY